MSSTRSAIGVAALWTTFCVVLLAAGWLKWGDAGVVRDGTVPALAQAEAASRSAGSIPTLPPAPCPEAPASEPGAAAESGADPESSSAAATLRLRRSAWIAVIPLWPADALRWQLMEPSLRLNPGHAPPTA